MKDKFNETKLDAADLAGKVQTFNTEVKETKDMNIPDVSTNTNVKEIDEPKAAINTKRAAEAVATGSSSGAATMSAYTRGRIGSLYSGGAGQVGDDLSATTRSTSSYKSAGRVGRRQDSVNRNIDLMNAEIIKTKIYQSKPLAETDSKQGYNGNYVNDHAITQKVNGGHPGDPLFERSVDEIELDMLYFADGQYNVSGNDLGEYNIHDYDTNTSSFEDNTIGLQRGNYLNRSLSFTVTDEGITNFAIQSTDIANRNCDEQTIRHAGDAALRTVNLRELDRNVMITKAGNESDPKWSPLCDAIKDASAQNMFLADLDATAGDLIYASRRKLSQALSYQLNKTAKDGIRVTGPIAEMLNGLVPNTAVVNNGSCQSVSEEEGIAQAFHNIYNLTHGGAGLYIGMNDSLPKYNTKAKVLNLPLSLKAAVNIAEANCGVFKCHETLIQEVEKNELFSTIDGPYDPLKPIIHTNGMAVITPINLSQCINLDEDNKVKDFNIYTLHYENLRNKYNIVIKNFFLEGIYKYLSDRAYRIYEYLRREDGSQTSFNITIPMVSTSKSISLWDLIVCSAVPYMVDSRLETLTEVLKYEVNFGYPYSGLKSLSDVQTCASENFSFSDINTEIASAIAKPIAAMKVVMPEIFWPVSRFECKTASDKNGIGCYTVLPHYFVQNQFEYNTEDVDDLKRTLKLSDDASTMAYPSTRSGSMLSYFDTIYGMSEEDYRLSLDRMVVYPGYMKDEPNAKNILAYAPGALGTVKDQFAALTYKYGSTADGQPVLPYCAYASDADDSEHFLTVADVIKTPREMGLMLVAPAGLITPYRRSDNGNSNLVDLDSSYLGVSGPGFKATLYHTAGREFTNAILGAGSTNINVSDSLRNVYITISAANYVAGQNTIGFAIGSWNGGEAELTPFAMGSYDGVEFRFEDGQYIDAETQYDGVLPLRTRARYDWTRMQRLPFAINPFDANLADISSTSSALINDHDIYDFLYMMGLCGFRASDYSAFTNERIKERIVKGMNYVIDPYVEKTNLLK